MQIKIREGIGLVLFAVAVVAIGASPALAQVSTSPNYQVTETQFNSGASLNSCSSGYCARVSIGDVGTGDSGTPGKSTAEFGPVTPDLPSLEVIVDPGISSLGTLTTETPGYKTMVVRVKSYLSNGYTLQINGTPPKYGNYLLNTPTSPTSSQPGTEQFGINVVDNSTPDVGANLVQVPDAETSFGQAMPNYSQPNKFMYNSGDVVAFSNRSSGRTDYTVSMLVNIAGNTPAGQFVGDYAAIVIPIY